MAGIVISKQQNNKNTKLKTGSQQQETANLNITLCTKPANICCCLCPQQPSVVATNTNNKLMKSNSTTNTCCWHNLTCKVDDRILTNYNCNIKSVQQKKHQQQQKRPLTLSIAVIIMSLSILLIQMPTMTASKAIYDERFSASSSSSSSALETSADYISEESETAETSMELKAELIDLLQREREIVALLDDEIQSSSSSSSDQLSSLDVIKHMQRTEEHQKERRKNLRKRHTNELIIKRYLEENDNNMEWVNPCNVYKVMPGMRTVSKYEKFQVGFLDEYKK